MTDIFLPANDDDLFVYATRIRYSYQSIPIHKMSGYESDSSGSEGDYTRTNVVLGYATKEPLDDTINQLGGYPVG